MQVFIIQTKDGVVFYITTTLEKAMSFVTGSYTGIGHWNIKNNHLGYELNSKLMMTICWMFVN